MIDKFDKPKVIGIIADVNSGKSNLAYYLMDKLNKNYKFSLYTFGLRFDLPYATKIHSLGELEQKKDSVIFLDEFCDLFDLDDRTKRRQIERTLRLIFHNNNVLVLIGLPENFKKFISAKLNIIFYLKVSFGDFINGSSAKKNILNYNGPEKGSAILNLEKNEVIVFDKRYDKYQIPYLEEYDSKKDNPDILTKKELNCGKSVIKIVEKL